MIAIWLFYELVSSKGSGKCYFGTWHMNHSELMNSRLPKLNGGRNWNHTLPLHHVFCFLGNDFVERNSIPVVATHLPNWRHLRRRLPIPTVRLDERWCKLKCIQLDPLRSPEWNPTHCNAQVKALWNDAKKRSHIKKWKEAMPMFTPGSAFIIKPATRNSNAELSFEGNPFVQGRILWTYE